MVLTPEEIVLAQNVMNSLQNATGYSYTTVVYGTKIQALLDFVLVIVSIIVATISAYLIRRYTVAQIERDRSYTREMPGPVFAPCIAFVATFILTALLLSLITGSLLGFFAPEYTVINKLLERCT